MAQHKSESPALQEHYSRPRNLPALTGLRGVAAVWVMLFHLTSNPSIPIIKDGYAGVDVFFLLSGFVLSYVYLHDLGLATRHGYKRFLVLRLVRIYPLHFSTLVCVLVMVWVLPEFTLPYHHAEARFGYRSFVANLLLVQDWGLFRQGSWNDPSWSLSAEWFAYLLFPFLLVPIRRIGSHLLLVLLAVAVLAGMAGLLYLAGYRQTNGTGLAGMVRMAAEFPAGCLLYAAFAKGWRVPAMMGQSLTAVLLAIGLLVPSYGLIMIFAFSLMIVMAAQGDNSYAKALQWRPIMFLGEISFSLYLTHWIIIQVCNWMRTHGLNLGETEAAMAALSVTFAVSMCSYHLIELPARQWGRGLVARNPLPRHGPAAVITE